MLGNGIRGVSKYSEYSNVEGVKDMGYRERRRYDRGPREMHKIICSDCGQEAEVPFKPTEGRPVYCQECFKKHRPPRY
jgi:CxxC-x17-CxxC domain-containing protein